MLWKIGRSVVIVAGGVSRHRLLSPRTVVVGLVLLQGVFQLVLLLMMMLVVVEGRLIHYYYLQKLEVHLVEGESRDHLLHRSFAP